MTTPDRAADEADVEIVEDDAAHDDGVTSDGGAATRRPWRGPSVGRWVLFAIVAVAVLLVDQLSKAWLAATLPNPGDALVVIGGGWLNVVHGRNSGALFGLLPQSAPVFAVVSLGVVALIVVYHQKAGRGIVTTLALALLLGGAIGNLLDRLRFGYVLDWIDMGVGSWRFWTYNVADAAITTAILLLLLMALVPGVGEWGAE